MAENALEPLIASLLVASGNSDGAFKLDPLSAGGNNRVYAVQNKHQRFLAKHYYHDGSDTRDRLGAEYAFLEHAWRIGLKNIPRPYACNTTAHLALYEFVEGEKLVAADITAQRVLEAARFFALLNSAQSRARATALPLASEACFSVTEQVEMIDGRIGRLDRIEPAGDVNREAVEFTQELKSLWQAAKRGLFGACKDIGLDAEELLPVANRCLSPSDFGFHNALRRADGSLCFIDFEYAGWDDPAKAVGDFFSHPGMPVSKEYLESFLAVAMTPFENPQASSTRARLLEPLFRFKWCCIILNEFLPASASRRRFADPEADSTQRKAGQLYKARTLFNTLQNREQSLWLT
ncbi:MAG: aminoglycoside phosphotransferase family protein [Burkholderiales bacterium]